MKKLNLNPLFPVCLLIGATLTGCPQEAQQTRAPQASEPATNTPP